MSNYELLPSPSEVPLLLEQQHSCWYGDQPF